MWLFLFGIFVGISLLLSVRFFRASKAEVEADWGHPRLNFLDGAVRLFCRRYHRLPDDVAVSLPPQGPAILVANHISGLDPLVLVSLCKRPLRFLIAREEYLRIKPLFKAAGCIPVDRERRPEKALREAFLALENGEVVALFPHGGIHWPAQPGRKVKGGAIRMAIKTGSPIYPVFISGIGAPGFTMLALPVRSRLKVTVGEPFFCTDASAYDEYVEKLDQLLNSVKH